MRKIHILAMLGLLGAILSVSAAGPRVHADDHFDSVSEDQHEKSDMRETMRRHCAHLLDRLSGSIAGNKNAGFIGRDVADTFSRIWNAARKNQVDSGKLVSRFLKWSRNPNDPGRKRLIESMPLLLLSQVKTYLHTLNNGEDVIDLTQEVYTAYWEELGRYHYTGPPTPGAVMAQLSFIYLRVEKRTVDYVLNQYVAPASIAVPYDWREYKAYRNLLSDPMYAKPIGGREGRFIGNSLDGTNREYEEALANMMQDEGEDVSLEVALSKHIANFITDRYADQPGQSASELRLNAMRRDVFFRILYSESPATLEKIADKYQVSRERIRQIRTETERLIFWFVKANYKNLAKAVAKNRRIDWLP